MTMVKVGSGWQRPENYFSKPDGTYPVTLTQIGVTAEDGTFTPGGRRMMTGGQWGDREVQDWTFATDDGEVIEAMVSAPRIAADGSEVIGPRSTYYAYVTALVGKEPATGGEFDPQRDLIGRMAEARIERDENDFPRIRALFKLSQPAPTANAAAPAEQPAEPAAAPLREQVAATDRPSAF